MSAATSSTNLMNQMQLFWTFTILGAVLMLLWGLARRLPIMSSSSKKVVAQRVIGCFDFQSVDEEDGDFWKVYKNPHASLGGLKHSAEFQAFVRDSNLDVDKEEEKLLAYSTLRKQDLEGFKKLLSGSPEDYQEFFTSYLPLPVAWLDYLFLLLGLPLAHNELAIYLCAWAIVLLCLITSRPSIFSVWLKAKGYYVTNQHNTLADRMRVACAWILELIFISYTSYLGVALSLLLKTLTEKRQGLMEHFAGVWIILERQRPVQIQ